MNDDQSMAASGGESQPDVLAPIEDRIDEIAADIAGIFEQTRWAWGLFGDVHIPEQDEIVEKIGRLYLEATRGDRKPGLALVSHGRIVLVVGAAAPYDKDVRVLVDIDELPLPVPEDTA